MSDPNSLSTILKERKLRANEVAEAIGVTPAAIHNWKLGVSRPNRANRTKLAKYLEIEPEELLFDPPSNPPPKAESNGGAVTITIRGNGMNIEVMVSGATALSVIRQIFPPNSFGDPGRHPPD